MSMAAMAELTPGVLVGVDTTRVCEVVATFTGRRIRRGSGFLLSNGTVLTAWHVIADATLVQVVFQAGMANRWSSNVTNCVRIGQTDVAAIQLKHVERKVEPVPLGRFGDHGVTLAADTVGFPRWKLRSGDRSTTAIGDGKPKYRVCAQVPARLVSGSNLRDGACELIVDPPAADSDPGVSPWEGMSGAPVFCGGVLVAVVTDHHSREGLGRLSAVRLDWCVDSLNQTEWAIVLPLFGISSTAQLWQVKRAAETTQTANPVDGLTVSQVHRVAVAIAAVPDVTTPEGRRHLAAALDSTAGTHAALLDLITSRLIEGQIDTISAALEARAASESDLLLVRQVDEMWRRQLWIAPALRTFRTVTGQQVRNAYFRAVPGDGYHTPEDLDEAMDLAAAHGRPQRGLAPLYRFVAVLEHMTSTKVDDQWYALAADRLRALRSQAAVAIGEPVRLVIDLRAPDNRSTWPDEVVGYLHVPGKGWSRSHDVRCDTTTAGAQQAVAALLRWVEEDKGVADFEVGLIVPRAGLDEVPEAWEYGNPLEEPTPLWHQKPTVLHSAERFGAAAARNRWKVKADEIRERLVNEAPDVLWIEHIDRDAPASIRMAVREAVAACVGLAFRPGGVCHDLRRDPIIATVTGGGPYLLWAEREPEDWLVAKRTLNELIVRGAFEELPSRVHRVRSADRDGLGGSLRLMWDDPAALPPVGQLTGMSTGSDDG